jgi:tetratricopeptide (TPR) repeat protein
LLLIHREPLFTFGILVYLISVLIFSNYLYPVPGMIADRFMLLPSLGWIIILAAILQKISAGVQNSKTDSLDSIPPLAKYSFLIVLSLYSSITFARNFDWKDDLTLFRHDIKYVDQSAQAHNLLGIHIMKFSLDESDPNKKIELEKEALYHLKRSIEIYPYFFNTAYDVGRVYMALNMPDSAIAAFRYSLTLDTAFTDAYLSIGSLLTAQSKFSEAVPYFESLIRINPNQYIGYERLSFLFFKMNQFDKSIQVNLNACIKLPYLPDPLINISRTYIAENKLDSAGLYLHKADILSPNNAAIKQMLQQINK